MTARKECLRPYSDGSARKHSICNESAQVTGGVNKALDRTGFIGSSLPASPAQSSRAGNLADGVSASSALFFHVGRYGEAVELVKRHHYNRRAPSNVQCVGTLHEEGGLFGDYGPAIAACFFSLPPTRWSEEVWELSRLVRTGAHFPLTGLIAQTCKAAKAKGANLLVSFADRTQGHHGGIYQAGSWSYAGCRERRMDGVIVDGRFVPGRSANSTWGTQSPSKLSELLRKDVLPHYDEGKHLYWRALTKEGKRLASRLGLASLPYPKPDMEKVAAE